MAYKYSRYISRAVRHPWAILPEKFAVLTELMRERAAGHRFSDEEIAERIGATSADRLVALSERRQDASARGGAIAVIPIHGVIAHRADSFEASSGGTSTELVGRMLQRADDSIASILLDVDSPGGSVEGVPELASQIAKATAVKPVLAHVNALAASASYWLASQATEVYITPSGMAGSIGVFLLLVDESEALAKEGIKINAISAGEHKLEGAFWEPLSDESREHFQGQVDAVYRDFLAAVAKGRGVNVAAVKKNFGQGRVYDAKEALERGMVDKLATAHDALAMLASGKVGRSGVRGEKAPVIAGMTIVAPVAAADLPDERFMGDALGQGAETVSPGADGECPEGYEKGDDGQCHMKAQASTADGDQAAADRDALDLASAATER